MAKAFVEQFVDALRRQLTAQRTTGRLALKSDEPQFRVDRLAIAHSVSLSAARRCHKSHIQLPLACEESLHVVLRLAGQKRQTELLDAVFDRAVQRHLEPLIE